MCIQTLLRGTYYMRCYEKYLKIQKLGETAALWFIWHNLISFEKVADITFYRLKLSALISSSQKIAFPVDLISSFRAMYNIWITNQFVFAIMNLYFWNTFKLLPWPRLSCSLRSGGNKIFRVIGLFTKELPYHLSCLLTGYFWHQPKTSL